MTTPKWLMLFNTGQTTMSLFLRNSHHSNQWTTFLSLFPSNFWWEVTFNIIVLRVLLSFDSSKYSVSVYLTWCHWKTNIWNHFTKCNTSPPPPPPPSPHSPNIISSSEPLETKTSWTTLSSTSWQQRSLDLVWWPAFARTLYVQTSLPAALYQTSEC